MVHFRIELPYPPSINHYYGVDKSFRKFIKPEGAEFRQQVRLLALLLPLEVRNLLPIKGRLRVKVSVYQPDKRRRDLDNVLKATLDGLQHAGVYLDDCMIDDLNVVRCLPEEKGKVLIGIWTIEDVESHSARQVTVRPRGGVKK